VRHAPMGQGFCRIPCPAVADGRRSNTYATGRIRLSTGSSATNLPHYGRRGQKPLQLGRLHPPPAGRAGRVAARHRRGLRGTTARRGRLDDRRGSACRDAIRGRWPRARPARPPREGEPVRHPEGAPGEPEATGGRPGRGDKGCGYAPRAQ
jgi:hypothetical protein